MKIISSPRYLSAQSQIAPQETPAQKVQRLKAELAAAEQALETQQGAGVPASREDAWFKAQDQGYAVTPDQRTDVMQHEFEESNRNRRKFLDNYWGNQST